MVRSHNLHRKVIIFHYGFSGGEGDRNLYCLRWCLLLGRTGGQLLVEKDVVSTFLTFHLLKLSCCTQIQVEGWLDFTVAAGADKANNKQIGKRSGHYRITGFLVILMCFWSNMGGVILQRSDFFRSLSVRLPFRLRG